MSLGRFWNFRDLTCRVPIYNAANGRCKWSILLEMAYFAANGRWKWSLQMVLLQMSYFYCKCPILLLMTCYKWQKSCCKWFSCKWFCCKWPKFRGSAETGLLQMTIHRQSISNIHLNTKIRQYILSSYWTHPVLFGFSK